MFEPTNEMGVVSFFSSIQHMHDFQIVRIGIEFPDAIVSFKGRELRVEFEYLSSNFLAHDHDVRECDVVVCWRNDLFEDEFPLHVIELSSNDWIYESIALPEKHKVEIFYWKSRARKAEQRLKVAQSEKCELEKTLQSIDLQSDRPSAEERRQEMQRMINEGDELNSMTLARIFSVSPQLIRKELKELRNGN